MVQLDLAQLLLPLQLCPAPAPHSPCKLGCFHLIRVRCAGCACREAQAALRGESGRGALVAVLRELVARRCLMVCQLGSILQLGPTAGEPSPHSLGIASALPWTLLLKIPCSGIGYSHAFMGGWLLS
jgi:hypothetical protein